MLLHDPCFSVPIDPTLFGAKPQLHLLVGMARFGALRDLPEPLHQACFDKTAVEPSQEPKPKDEDHEATPEARPSAEQSAKRYAHGEPRSSRC